MSRHPSVPSTVLQCEQLEDRLALDATSYVKSLYQNLLNRAADSGGLAFWVNQINNGMSNFQVAQDFWRSAEHRGIEIDSYYQNFLGRTADPAGRAFWVNQMMNGASEVQVIARFFTSGEYISEHPTPDAYVTALYANILGRTPAGSELIFWDNELAMFGAGTVTLGILTSTESAVDIITRDYITFLSRTPDTAGLNSWLAQFQNGASIEQVAEGILGSPEYAAKH
jgi:hypothetical protein